MALVKRAPNAFLQTAIAIKVNLQYNVTVLEAMFFAQQEHFFLKRAKVRDLGKFRSLTFFWHHPP